MKYLIVAFTLLTVASCTKVGCVERLKKNCFTTQDVSPVCGCNHKTYINASVAACAQVDVAHTGACQ